MEQNFFSPFCLHLINLLPNDEACNEYCNNMYEELNKKEIDIIYDDRDERPGKKFSDADLIGIPFQIIVGNNLKSNNEVSIIDRLKKNEEKIKSEILKEYLINEMKL